MDQLAVPLIVVTPLSKTVEDTVPLVMKEGSRFALRVCQLQDVAFPTFPPDLPHVFVFSFSNAVTRGQVKELIEKLSKVPPLWRLIVISEDKRGTPAENWKQRGVHELILGPILGRAFLLKLDRHHKKISKEWEEQEAKKSPAERRPPLTAHAKVAGQVDSVTGNPYDFVVHGEMLGPNSFLFKKTAEEDFKKVVVNCAVPEMMEGNGQWVRNSEQAIDPGTGEAVWDWVLSMKKEDKESGFRFVGDRPVFDKESGQWVFAGKAPMFFHRGQHPHAPHLPELPQAPHSGDENMVFGYSTKTGVIMYKGHVDAGTARILYVRRDDFSDSNLRFLQKKKEPVAAKPETDEAADADLLAALNEALKKEKK